eukprot:jgi/Undpi1/13415/HiC_scaffold_8.g03074.m1
MIRSAIYSDFGAAAAAAVGEEAPHAVGDMNLDHHHHHADSGMASTPSGFAGGFVFGPDGVPIANSAGTPSSMPVDIVSIGTPSMAVEDVSIGLGAREGGGGGGPLEVLIGAGDAVRLGVDGLDSLVDGTGGGVEEEGRQRRRRRRSLRTTHCEESQCFKGPSYGPNGTPPLRCSLHKVPGDAYVKNQCISAGCSKVCSFGPAGERPQYCSAHRRGGMVDVKSKVCAERGCDKRSSFGEAGMPPRFCAKHRPHGMVDVVHRRCETPLCQRHPTYGYRGQRRRFCAHHMESADVRGAAQVSKFLSRGAQHQHQHLTDDP